MQALLVPQIFAQYVVDLKIKKVIFG